MRILLGYRLGSLHSGGRVRIGPTTRLAVNAGLHVGAVVGSLVETDTALVADCDLLDMSGVVGIGLGKAEADEDRRADGWANDAVS